MMTFGDKLQRARKAAGLVQVAFMEQLNIASSDNSYSQGTISLWENSAGKPKNFPAELATELLGVAPDYFNDDNHGLPMAEHLAESIYILSQYVLEHCVMPEQAQEMLRLYQTVKAALSEGGRDGQ